MPQPEALDPKLVGQRLAEARKARALTQEDVAKFLECSRPTYIAIEKGERPAKAEEIIKLAGFFGRTLHEIVRPGEPIGALQPHLRAVTDRMKPADGRGLLEAIDELQRFAEDYLELERLLNAPLRSNPPPEVKLDTRVDAAELAETVAVQERRRLGLGDQPVLFVRRILEWDVGLRIFYGEKLPSAVAGMYACTADLGCCILINRKHPPQRRRMSLVHEYAHLIVDRYKPGIDYVRTPGRKPPNERFAEAFALSFLMPASSVRAKFHEIVSSTGDFKVADLSRMSHHYFVSVEAMTLRLEKLGLIPKGSYDNLKESKFSPQKAAQMLGLPQQPINDQPYPERYKFLAVAACEQGKITQMCLANFLRCDLISARQIITQCLTSTDVAADGSLEGRRLDEFQQSLLAGAP
ncbi:MAG: ImmA/IrrE family metallo-endopeptidase [Planctomycetia bacterium]|nr:ImmA/IrrE family metallo-endopeptidase [Planctomycetia bacterium]